LSVKVSGWAKRRICDLVISADAGVSVNGEARQKKDGETAVLKVSSVSSMFFNPCAHKVVIKEDLSRVKESPIKNHIIISRSNTPELVGASALVNDDYPELFLSDKLWQLKFKKKYEAYVYWLTLLLASPPIRHLLSRLATGTSNTMKNISKNDFLTLPFLLPPFEEQTEIARIFLAWQTATSLIKKLIVEKRKLRRALMQQLLSGKQRFPGFVGLWRTVRLGKVFSNRVEFNRVDLPLLSITSNGGIVNRNTVGRRDSSSKNKSCYLLICLGDIGYNTMRMWQGVSGLSALEGIVSPAYTVVTPDSCLDAEFMAVLFKYPPVINLFRRYSQGLVNDTLNLKYRNFSEITVTIPNKKEQTKIAIIFRSLDRELQFLQRELDALDEQKRGLMQQLLTGKKRVKAAKVN